MGRRCTRPRRRFDPFPGGFLRRLRGRFLLSQRVEVLAHEFGMIEVERARVRLLLRDANLREVLDQDFGLDLEFPGQLINPDLVRIRH